MMFVFSIHVFNDQMAVFLHVISELMRTFKFYRIFSLYVLDS